MSTTLFTQNEVEEEIEIEITPPSKDDENRKELPWESREERIIQKWAKDCKRRSIYHTVKAKQTKLKYSIFGVPTILIPIVLGGVSSVIPCHSIIYSVGMMLSGLLSATSMFFNYGKKTEEHFNYGNKFFELSNEIDSELCKPKRHRIDCSVYMEKIFNHQTYNLVQYFFKFI